MQMQVQHSSSEEEFYASIEEEFIDACRYNQDTVDELLAHENLDFTFTNEQNNNCLHMAVGNGHIDVVNKIIQTINTRQLKEKAQIIDKQNSDGNTPLHYAVISKKVELIDILIKEGANANIKNQAGRTPLKQAIEFSSGQIAEALAKVTEIDPEDLEVQQVAQVEGGNQKIQEQDIGDIERGMEVIEIEEEDLQQIQQGNSQ